MDAPAVTTTSLPTPLSLLPTATLIAPPRPLDDAPVLIDTPPALFLLVPDEINTSPEL